MNEQIDNGEELTVFGSWKIVGDLLSSGTGFMPLDAVSCVVIEKDPPDSRKTLLGLICLAFGGYILSLTEFKSGSNGFYLLSGLLLLLGVVLIIVAMNVKSAYRVYSTSGAHFVQYFRAIDLKNDIVKQFQKFSLTVVKRRDAYLRKVYSK